MTDESGGAERVATSVADGEPVDWDAARRSASDDRERLILDHLRLVEEVARVHRTASSARSTPHGAPAASPAALAATTTLNASPRPAIESWGPLELREKLDEGSFGEVYRAWDRQLEREVALKLLKDESAVGKSVAAKAVAEGRILARLRHANVVTVYGAEMHDGRAGFWMELIRGRSLAGLLRDQGPFGGREAALVGVDLCKALAAVHGAGIVHRDVKAENAMREEGGRILLTDFGAGVEMAAGADEQALSGTPLYMAPELFHGEPASRRSDLYSLGVLLYHLVTGSFPVEATSWRALKEKHAQGEARLLRDRRPDLPEGFAAVIERATAADPGARFATAGEMEQALAHFLGTAKAAAPETRRRSPGWLPVLLGAGLTAAAAALIVFMRLSPAAGPAPPGPVHPPAPPQALAGAPPYTVEATLYRFARGSTQREQLAPGARLALGDRLSLEFMASAPLHVYVFEADDAGHSYALFPIPGLSEQNPLAAGAAHVLPGVREGKAQSWEVNSPGGREHLIVLASRDRQVRLEAEMSKLARPGEGAVPLTETAQLLVRGIGGLTEAPATGSGASARPLFEMAQSLASQSEVAQGVWMRQIDLENPRP